MWDFNARIVLKIVLHDIHVGIFTTDNFDYNEKYNNLFKFINNQMKKHEKQIFSLCTDF